jgi:hypothetical protein
MIHDATRCHNEGRENLMSEVENLDRKRVCDISTDKRLVEIRRKDCVTRITARPDGTLNITQERIAKTA